MKRVACRFGGSSIKYIETVLLMIPVIIDITPEKHNWKFLSTDDNIHLPKCIKIYIVNI